MRSTGSAINPSTLGSGNASGVGWPSQQLFPQFRSANYYPRPLAAVGPGAIGSRGASRPAFPPQSSGPAFPSGQPVAGGKGGTGLSIGGSNSGNPFHPLQSPVIVALVALFAGFLLLRYVHHGY